MPHSYMMCPKAPEGTINFTQKKLERLHDQNVDQEVVTFVNDLDRKYFADNPKKDFLFREVIKGELPYEQVEYVIVFGVSPIVRIRMPVSQIPEELAPHFICNNTFKIDQGVLKHAFLANASEGFDRITNMNRKKRKRKFSTKSNAASLARKAALPQTSNLKSEK